MSRTAADDRVKSLSQLLYVCVSVLQLLFHYVKSGGGELLEPVAVLGQENMRVQLPCALPHADTPPPRVQWFDLVYNTSPEPIRIFDSRNNSNRQTDRQHPNRHNYQVCTLLSWYDGSLVDGHLLHFIILTNLKKLFHSLYFHCLKCELQLFI